MANETITAVRGFSLAAVQAGIKASGKLDLGLIVAGETCTAAGCLTRNKIASPTIAWDRRILRRGRARAVFVNAGNANACTGTRGADDVHRIARQIQRELNIPAQEVLVTSTGIIGVPLPMDKVRRGITRAAGSLSQDPAAADALARAILTTDTRPKQAFRRVSLDGRTVTLAGIAKGSGMIAPNMATMLAYIVTDVNISGPLLRQSIRQAVEHTFNKVSVDNHSSSNDAVLLLASGKAHPDRISRENDRYHKFDRALRQLCDDLARQIAADGEGATRLITVLVRGAASQADARKAVRAIVNSPLVRCAFHGADPNWGRIVTAVGYSGARFDPEKITCRIAGTRVFQTGRPARFDPKTLSARMREKQWEVCVDLGLGDCRDFCYTCDLSRDYVTINADYHT